jgi:hypothetical protein
VRAAQHGGETLYRKKMLSVIIWGARRLAGESGVQEKNLKIVCGLEI